MTRSRFLLAAQMVLVIALGLSCRRQSAAPFVQLYVGDVLWGSLFFLLAAWLWPQRSALSLGLLAVLSTELIELSQLYQSDWMLALRATRAGGLLLGHQFLWSDVLCVFIGAAGAALVDRAFSASALRGAGGAAPAAPRSPAGSSPKTS